MENDPWTNEIERTCRHLLRLLRRRNPPLEHLEKIITALKLLKDTKLEAEVLQRLTSLERDVAGLKLQMTVGRGGD